ncbi:hypothetical protein ACTXT7_001700 [Hymenolepis weldensis]
MSEDLPAYYNVNRWKILKHACLVTIISCDFISVLFAKFYNNRLPVVHAVKNDDNDKINEELLRRLRIQDSAHGSKSTMVEGLSKNQLKAAIIHLIEFVQSIIYVSDLITISKDVKPNLCSSGLEKSVTDDDLMTKLHSAYTESLNKRLNRRA